MSSDHRLKSLKYIISPKGDLTPYSKKFKSVKDINIKLKESKIDKSQYTSSLTNFDLDKNKPKSINISKQFPFIKNNFIITKKTDYYPDQKRDYEIKTLKKFHNYNFINTYVEYSLDVYLALYIFLCIQLLQLNIYIVYIYAYIYSFSSSIYICYIFIHKYTAPPTVYI